MGHRPKIGDGSPESFWKPVLFRRLQPTPILVDHGTGGIGKIISLAFHAYVDDPNQRSDTSCTSIWKQGDPGLRVGLEVKLLDSKLAWTSTLLCVFPWISNNSLCPTCPPWLLITIKSLGSHLSSRSLADKHKKEFTWWRSHCACDLIIGPYTSIGVVVSDVVMSSSDSPLYCTSLPCIQ
jgi:hypothetical protein